MSTILWLKITQYIKNLMLIINKNIATKYVELLLIQYVKSCVIHYNNIILTLTIR